MEPCLSSVSLIEGEEGEREREREMKISLCVALSLSPSICLPVSVFSVVLCFDTHKKFIRAPVT